MLLLLAALPSLALAADLPQVAVVGVHVPGLDGADAEAAAARLVEAVEASDKADALAPREVSALLVGKETLALDAYALGQGRERLNEAKVLFAQANADEAIPKFEEAVRLLTDGLAVSTDPRDLHEALIALGQSYVGLGNDDAARRTFARLVEVDPARMLDPVKNSPDVLAAFNAAREAVQARPSASLSVTVAGDARLWVDGRDVGALPVTGLELPPGSHTVLVRAADGNTAVATFELKEGESRNVDARLRGRGLGATAGDSSGRSRQVRDLYRGVGQFTGRPVLLLAGMVSADQVGVQLYSPSTGSFSRVLNGEAGKDPVAAVTDLLPGVLGYLGENGTIRSDKVGTQVVPLDVSANDVLAGMLLSPPEPEVQTVEVSRGPKWYVWAGLGAVVAGGGAAATYLALAGEDEPVTPTDQGTISVGPIP